MIPIQLSAVWKKPPQTAAAAIELPVFSAVKDGLRCVPRVIEPQSFSVFLYSTPSSPLLLLHYFVNGFLLQFPHLIFPFLSLFHRSSTSSLSSQPSFAFRSFSHSFYPSFHQPLPIRRSSNSQIDPVAARRVSPNHFTLSSKPTAWRPCVSRRPGAAAVLRS